MTKLMTLALVWTSLLMTGAVAQDKPVGLTKDMLTATVETPDGPVEIGRIQDNDNEVSGEWAKTSRACPPFCIQPVSPAEGVNTIGELELIALLQDPDAIVMDSRTPDWFKKGSIPGARNVPYTQIEEYIGELGCEPDFDGWLCDEAKTVALFCNGLWCGQSPVAIRTLVDLGFPAEKIHYYRGGMQSWRVLGLTVTDPAS